MKPDQPIVSVIVPFYGVEKYIAQCAESLLSQTYPHIQYIFVNDGSKDRSAEVLSNVLLRYPERDVRVVEQENAGIPQARAAGLRQATGRYILHVDSDDWVETDAVERLVACAEATEADLVYFDVWKEYGSHRKLSRERDYTAAEKVTYLRRLYRDKAYGFLCTKFARRELYEGVFFPKYNMHEDIVVATQLIFKASRLVHLDMPLLHYRRDNQSAATRVSKVRRRGQSARNFLDLYEAYAGCLEGSPVEPVLNDILLRSAWVGFTLDRNLFTERPYLRGMARRLPLIPGHRVLLIQQLVLKVYLNLL